MKVGHWAGAVALATLFLALHLPFLPASLEDLDSINFAFGVRHFDVAHHQPHPPGYPVFMLVAKTARELVSSEAHALSAVGIVAAGLAVFALMVLFGAIDRDPRAPAWSIVATLLTVTSPLYWFTAARPLSDATGLAAAVAVQAATLTATSRGALAGASFLAALAVGLRSQVVWLTAPLLLLTIARRPAGERGRVALASATALGLGGLVWGVPLILVSGGPAAYWTTVFQQGAEDLSGIRMLWTTPTPRQFLLALQSAFVAPWAGGAVAAAALALAIVGAARLSRSARPALVTLAAAFGPYLIFDLAFQETITTRYALPLVVPVAYLAARGLDALSRRTALVIALFVAVFNAATTGFALQAYSRFEAPAFRLLDDMRARAPRTPSAPAPVLAMHRRGDLDLRRPMQWAGNQMPPVSLHLPAPPKHEWLELVKYWNGGGKNDVWFVADPLRTDLALVDRERSRSGAYRWPLKYHELVGGVRPDVMDWYVLHQPGWYLGEGWALTPETAGVAKEDGRGPGLAPIPGWIRRRPEAATLLVGGRNLSLTGPAAHVRVAIDARTIGELTVAPGFFMRLFNLPAGALAGVGDYATVAISADQPNTAIEQFDVQSADRVVFGFGDGWHEQEYNPATGVRWRWLSDRAVLRVHASGRPLMLTLSGEPPRVYFWKPSHIKISAGGRIVAEETLSNGFSVQVRVPAELLTGDESTITIETDQTYVPAEGFRRSPDRRRLGLRVFDCDLRPVS